MASAVQAAAVPMRDQMDEGLAVKRKHVNGDMTRLDAEQQSDLLEVLRSDSTCATILDHEFNDHNTTEPAAKRAKVSISQRPKTTISSKLQNGRYTLLSTISEDATHVRDELVNAIRQADGEKTTLRPSVGDLKSLQRIHAAEQLIQDILRRETIRDEYRDTGAKQESIQNERSISAEDRKQLGTVLTLFGNAPTPKQLFSSLQNSLHNGSSLSVKSEIPVEEMSLPIGLSATTIQPSSLSQPSKHPTFAESFPPAFSLPQLSPPKITKRPSTRNGAVRWEFQDGFTKGGKRGGYTTLPQTTASWLSYGVVDPQLTPSEKARQRERALSSAAGEPESQTANMQVEAEKLEELMFKKAYSSFAPAFDNSRAVVDASVKNMVWWHKYGSKRFDRRFAHDPLLVDSSNISSTPPQLEEMELEDEDFSKAVEEYDEDSMRLEEDVIDPTNVNDVLKKINDLIRTLASYQRLRNGSLTSTTSNTRIPISPSTLSASYGKPDEPAEEEVNTYNDLRREISYLILKLPPYAVAKLDGNQLADLGVSKVIPLEGNDYRGQMEEDQVARLAKAQAAATAAGIAALNKSGAMHNPHYSNPRAPAIGQSANTRYVTGYNTARTPLSAHLAGRPSSGQANYSTPTGASRAQLAQPGNYARAGASQTPQSQANGQYYGQRQTQPTNYAQYGQSSAQSALQRSVYANTAQQQLQQQRGLAQSYSTPGSQDASGAHGGLTNGSNVGHTDGRVSRTGTPGAYNSPAHTPVNGLMQARAPPPLVPRGDSGTPNPPAPKAINGSS